MTHPAVLNTAFLARISAGDTSLEKRLIHLFKGTAEMCLQKMSDDITDGTQGKWRESVHQLKGAAAAIGAEEITGLCAEAEFFGANAEEQKKASLDALKLAYGRFRAEIPSSLA